MTNLGAVVTVQSAATSSWILLNETNYQSGSGYETWTKVPAGPGAKFVVVHTSARNGGKSSMDLTCSGVIQAKVVDDQGRQYDPIDKLYQIKGNPECNHSLNPGFSEPMEWDFRVPSSAHLVGMTIQDISDITSGVPEPTMINFPVSG